jgi:cold shock CspA family protein
MGQPRNNNAAPRVQGRIKWFSEEKNHGIVVLDNYDEVYLHSSQWLEDIPPRKGDLYSLARDRGRDGRPFARNAMLVANEKPRART